MKRHNLKAALRAVVALGMTVALASCAALGAKDQVTRPADELLAAMPAQSTTDGAAAFDEMLRMGPAGLADICNRLVPPGTGDDTQARNALSGLAKHVSQNGIESQRRLLADVVMKALDASSNDEVKAFLIRQLQVIGKDECIAPLSAYLGDVRLSEPATQALLAIGSKSAAEAIAAALPAPTDAQRVTIVKALGELRYADALDQLLEYAASNNTMLRRTALFAVANIGDAKATDVIAKATKAEGSYEQSVATSAYVLFAQRLAESGQKKQCRAICDELIANRAEEPQVYAAALTTLVDAFGKGALDDLLAAMDTPCNEVRGHALLQAPRIEGKVATNAWVDCLDKAAPKVKTDIIRMLGDRGDRSALPALLAALKSDNAAVRSAAINASAKLGGEDAVPALLDLLTLTEDEAVIKTTKAAILRIGGDTVMPNIAAALPKVTAPARKALLEILAARYATGEAEAVFSCATDPDEAVRVAALKALPNVADPKDLPRVVDLAIAAKSDGERGQAEKAVVALANQLPDDANRAAPVLAKLDGVAGASRASLLKTLSGIGGADALAAVVADTKSGDAVVKDAAIRSLANWPTAHAAPELLAISQGDGEVIHQVLSLQGYIRLAGAADFDATQKQWMYQHALQAAKRPEEKKAALAGLSEIRTVDALEVVGRYLDDAELKAEAALAAVKIACPRDDKDKGLLDPGAVPVLERVAASAEDENLRKKAAAHLPKAAAAVEEGFVTLFNGKDLTGWVGDTKGYIAENGELVCKPGGNLYTAKEYGDFVFRFEFKFTPGANNGLCVRGPIGGGAYNGMELQILENTAEKYAKLQPYQYHGSIYGIVAAKRGHLKPVGEWNRQEVIAKGRQITVKLNGTVIVDADLDEASTPKTADGKEHKGLDRAKGHLGFLGHGDLLWFRNIRIKELD
ncbi:MAG: DUF1080 domain-containing protein [bacterium]|nr:DUF1080 domain-containing protein [bacterium]